tara:strand:- start:507 stop:1718 length:1212 start_codon:yes stop_codon:yes gene_type:complete
VRGPLVFTVSFGGKHCAIVGIHFELATNLCCDGWTMQVALMANTAHLTDEQSMFRFLVVGLLDEQIQVIQMLPQGTSEVASFAKSMLWQEGLGGHVSRLAVASLSDQLIDQQVSVLHAVDGQLWEPVLHLGRRLHLPVVLSMTSVSQLSQVKRLRRRISANCTAFCVATKSLAKAVSQLVSDSILVEVIPLGVPMPSQFTGAFSSEIPSIVITGTGCLDEDYQLVLEQLVRLAGQYPDLLLFFEASGGEDQRQIWQAARRFGLHAQCNFIPSRLRRRDWLADAQMLVVPQALGAARSIVLAAMACGLPVLAQRDPWLDYLRDGQTAWLVDAPDSQSWAQLLQRPLEDIDQTRCLVASARKWVAEHHTAAMQVAKMVDLYRRVAGEAYPFPTGHRVAGPSSNSR